LKDSISILDYVTIPNHYQFHVTRFIQQVVDAREGAIIDAHPSIQVYVLEEDPALSTPWRCSLSNLDIAELAMQPLSDVALALVQRIINSFELLVSG
jgi:hypothetical protein